MSRQHKSRKETRTLTRFQVLATPRWHDSKSAIHAAGAEMKKVMDFGGERAGVEYRNTHVVEWRFLP